MRKVIFYGGCLIMLPAVLVLGLLWFAETLRAHSEAQALHAAAQAAKLHRSYSPTIPQCDRPLWDRVTEGCPEEVDRAGS